MSFLKSIGSWLLGQLLNYIKDFFTKLFSKWKKKETDEKEIDQTMDTYEARVEEIKTSETMTEEEKNEALINAFRNRDA